MQRILKTLSVAAVAIGLIAISVPAQAKEISAGRAVVRIDIPSATVATVGKNAYRMVVASTTTGQWMGERTLANGRSKTLVRKLTAGALGNNWSNFRYTKAGVPATLVWADADSPMTVRIVKLGRPEMTADGVVFNFTTPQSMPETITDASLNLQRAPQTGKRTRDSTSTYTVTGTLMVSIEVVSIEEAKIRIYNSSNDNTCWGTTTITSSEYRSVPSNTCATIPYANYFATSTYPWGVHTLFNNPCNSFNPGTVTVTLLVSPPGQTPFKPWTQARSMC
ncbi:MAG: hypothetical protein ACR2JV_05525 [Gaiellales bacterium]